MAGGVSVNRETRIGLIAFLVLLILAVSAFVFPVRKIFFRTTYTVYAVLYNAGGIARGADVLYAGVPIGKVEKISVDGTKAMLTLEIQKDNSLPADVNCMISSDFFTGRPSLRIFRDSTRGIEHYLKDGDTITERRDEQAGKILEHAEKLMKSAEETQENWMKFTGAAGKNSSGGKDAA